MSPSGRVTNLFLPEPEVRRLLEAGEMEALEFAGGLALARTVADFRRLYFAAESALALAELRLPPGEFVTDVVGRESEIAPVAAALAGAGFAPYKEFRRMSRSGGPVGEPEPGVRHATAGEAAAIYRLIHAHFDARAEHLPSLEEVTAAITGQTVLIADSGGTIGALLFHSGTAITTTLRYWLVLPQCRGKGYGRRLLERYFADCVSCRRFLLWVQSDNARAIAQYERAGYRPDGLIDRILRKSN
jgi:ribosomal protein S18 acetylase RimI-like enzyme